MLTKYVSGGGCGRARLRRAASAPRALRIAKEPEQHQKREHTRIIGARLLYLPSA